MQAEELELVHLDPGVVVLHASKCSGTPGILITIFVDISSGYGMSSATKENLSARDVRMLA
jgi:hypothetical protein